MCVHGPGGGGAARLSRRQAVYFSGSFSLLPQPLEALGACKRLLRSGGRIYITQTFQRAHSAWRAPLSPAAAPTRAVAGPVLEVVKPLLKPLTRIDFGELCYEVRPSAGAGAGWRLMLHARQSRLNEILAASGMEVEVNQVIAGSIDNELQSARLVVLRP